MKEMKKEVEGLLGFGISDEEFAGAFKYAKRKQDWIYMQEHRPETLERSYLAKLTEEYVRQLAFSDFTLDLRRTLNNMEKEHPFNKEQGAPNAIPIVNVFAT